MARQKLISRAVVRQRGVPVGYVHQWLYRGKWVESKITPKTWKIRFVASKKKTNLKGSGGLPVGSRVRWRIIAIQDAIKLKDGLYMTDLKGFKNLVEVKINGGKEVRNMPKVFKTKKGNLVRVRNGVKEYYDRKSKTWKKSKYQNARKKKSVKKRSYAPRKSEVTVLARPFMMKV